MNVKFVAAHTIALGLSLVLGCGSGGGPQNRDFFTSGNREADQRAEQRMAKAQQTKSTAGDKSGGQAPENLPLFQRVGGETGINAIAEDFVTRAMDDPRVNWKRAGVKRGGFMSVHSSDSMTWDASPYNVEQLKKHIAQFLLLACGGPAKYDGKDMTAAHHGLHITNAEFDASVGDFKATLDKLQVPVKEQKELLAIMESTRPQVVEER